MAVLLCLHARLGECDLFCTAGTAFADKSKSYMDQYLAGRLCTHSIVERGQWYRMRVFGLAHLLLGVW